MTDNPKMTMVIIIVLIGVVLLAMSLSSCAGLCGYHGPRGCEADNTDWKGISQVMKQKRV